MVYGDDGSVYDIEPNTHLEGSSMERGLFHLYLVGAKLLRMGDVGGVLGKGL